MRLFGFSIDKVRARRFNGGEEYRDVPRIHPRKVIRDCRFIATAVPLFHTYFLGAANFALVIWLQTPFFRPRGAKMPHDTPISVWEIMFGWSLM